jgi:hypothetical protein
MQQIIRPQSNQGFERESNNKQCNERDAMVKKEAATEKETFKEPGVKWKESKARHLLCKDVVEGRAPGWIAHF